MPCLVVTAAVTGVGEEGGTTAAMLQSPQTVSDIEFRVLPVISVSDTVPPVISSVMLAPFVESAGMDVDVPHGGRSPARSRTTKTVATSPRKAAPMADGALSLDDRGPTEGHHTPAPLGSPRNLSLAAEATPHLREVCYG